MTTCSGDFDRSFDMLLAFDISKVRLGIGRSVAGPSFCWLQRGENRFSAKKSNHFGQGGRGVDLDPGYDRSFSSVSGWKKG